MQIKETIGVSFPSSVESPPVEDVIVLVDSAGVALGVQHAFSARVRDAAMAARRGFGEGQQRVHGSLVVQRPVILASPDGIGSRS